MEALPIATNFTSVSDGAALLRRRRRCGRAKPVATPAARNFVIGVVPACAATRVVGTVSTAKAAKAEWPCESWEWLL